MSDMLEGSEPRELIREYYRLRAAPGPRRIRRRHGRQHRGLAWRRRPRPGPEAFLGWYAARHDDVPQDVADVAGLILYEWGPGTYPEEHSRYACSPHRIEMTARLIRDGLLPRPR